MDFIVERFVQIDRCSINQIASRINQYYYRKYVCSNPTYTNYTVVNLLHPLH